MTYDYLAFVGRFQPFHLGHKQVVDAALETAGTVILLIGSANVARSQRNPFTYEERAAMINAIYRHEIATKKLVLRPIDDFTYNDMAWTSAVQRQVTDVVRELENPGDASEDISQTRIGLTGFGKDGSSFYLKMFPEWGNLDVKPKFGVLSSTDIREDYFRGNPSLPHDACPEPVIEFLQGFRETEAFDQLVREANFVKDYRAKWAAAPFPPTFVTVDAVVVQSGHVLLVTRGQDPGAGLLALPGGFVDGDEKLRNAAIRELKEETQIADQKGPIPPAMLGSFIEDRETRVFDDPYRSARGRTITHAFLFRLPDRDALFKVKGSDDAAHAQWYRLGDLDPRHFFDDHWFILQEMTGI